MKRTFILTAAAMVTNCLASTTYDRAGSILNQGLGARNPETRMQAVQAVGGLESFSGRLEAMLGDKDMRVRIAAIEALAGLGTERSLAALRPALDDKLPEVRFAAAKALFKLHDESGRKALVAVLSEGRKTSSGFVAEQVREGKKTLENPKKLARTGIKVGVALGPVPMLNQGVAAVEGAMANRSESDRAATALLLAGDHDPAVMEALRKALSDKNARTRAAAAKAIAMEGDASVRRDLERLLDDKNGTVRMQAAAGVVRLGVEE